MAWQLSIKFMAVSRNSVLAVSKIPGAISAVITAIDDGVEQARNLVEYAAPPEKVVFSGGAALSFNSIERRTITETPPKVAVTEIEAVSAKDEFFLNGVLVETRDYIDSSGYTVTKTWTKDGPEIVTEYEDNSIGFILEVPGPKSS